MAPESLDRRVIRTSVDWSGSGIALDIYLTGRFTYRSLEEWRDRIRGGEILLNGELSAPDRILALHDPGSNTFPAICRNRKPICVTGSPTRTRSCW